LQTSPYFYTEHIGKSSAEWEPVDGVQKMLVTNRGKHIDQTNPPGALCFCLAIIVFWMFLEGFEPLLIFLNGTHDDKLDFVVPLLDKPIAPYEEIWVLSTIWNEMGSYGFPVVRQPVR